MFSLPYETVVVPVDLSDASLEAVKLAAAAAEPGALRVLHVVESAHLADPYAVWLDVDDQRRLAAATEHLKGRLAQIGLDLQAEVRLGIPAQRIVEYAEEIGADLIVLPTHGRTGPTRWLMGSVAEKVARLAPCAVLVLRQP